MPTTQAATRIQNPTRRLFQVFVEIPYSPRPFASNMSTLKRKPSQSDISQTSAKKPKPLDTTTNAVKEPKTNGKDSTTAPKENLTKVVDERSEFPNGYQYCHQCNKKRDVISVLQCTSLNPNTDKPCKGKYCKSCLINRYGQDIESIKSGSVTKPGSDLDYTFKCPRCQGVCNCRNCRKAQGLEPTGNLTIAARKAGQSAAQLLVANPDRIGILPGKGQQVIPEKKLAARASKKAEGISGITLKGASTVVAKPRARSAKQAKPASIPVEPKWTRISVPADMALDDLETRMFIREFMLRFSVIMDKDAKVHLEELEEIIGDSTLEWTADTMDSDAEDDDNSTEAIPMVSWVSESCTKSIFIGLLGLLAESNNAALKKPTIDASLKSVRNSSANLTKIWIALASMRKDLGGAIDIPDPLPPPTSMPVYQTRRGTVLDSAAEGVQVGRSAQLIPLIIFLIHELLVCSKAVKTQLDGGMVEGRETVKQVRDALNKENGRWKVEKDKANGKPSKEAREAHKRKLEDLEYAQRILAYSNMLRFGPLGADEEGRVYYALSPGLAEREAALGLIDGEVNQKPKRGRKVGGGLTSVEERKALVNWSWFVAVWGKKPTNAKVEEEDEALDDEKEWWGFWEPEQIKNLAQWIAIRNGLDGDDSVGVPAAGCSAASIVRADSEAAGSSAEGAAKASNNDVGDDSPLTDLEAEDEDDGDVNQPVPSNKALKNLVDGLNDYSALLSWRINRGERRVKEFEGANGKPEPGKSVRRVRD